MLAGNPASLLVNGLFARLQLQATDTQFHMDGDRVTTPGQLVSTSVLLPATASADG